MTGTPMEEAEKWESYWSKQKSTHNRYLDAQMLNKIAAEFHRKFDFGTGSVLEIGCGDGELTEALGFMERDYIGVDFALKLIEQFKSRQPSVTVHESDGSRFLVDQQFNLIFSNQVLQNFDAQMLSRFFANSVKMLEPDGQLICGNVPNKTKRFSYSSGLWEGKPSLKGAAAHFIRPSSMLWWSKKEFTKLASEAGLKCTFFDSTYFSYRFHCQLTLDKT